MNNDYHLRNNDACLITVTVKYLKQNTSGNKYKEHSRNNLCIWNAWARLIQAAWVCQVTRANKVIKTDQIPNLNKPKTL